MLHEAGQSKVRVRGQTLRLPSCASTLHAETTALPPQFTSLLSLCRQTTRAYAATPLLVLLLVTGFGDDGVHGVKKGGRQQSFGITGAAAATVLGVSTVTRESCIGLLLPLCMCYSCTCM